MLAAATICDSQGIKNKFFMGIGYSLSLFHTQLFYLALLFVSLILCQASGCKNWSWVTGSGQEGEGGYFEDIYYAFIKIAV